MTPALSTHLWTRASAFVLMLVLFVMLGVVPGRAEAQSAANSKFDHFKTGFPLNGAHATQRCESCHNNGIFKGTPRDCQTCHTQGSRLAKSNVVIPPTHIPTNASTQGCDSCHGTQSFSNPRFSHTTGIPPGTACQTCHDGVRSQGKTANHIATRATCDSCHTTRNWNGAKPDHSGFNVSTNCASCHNGSAASGKTASHIPVSANCVSCHSVNGWKPTSWNHTQVMVSGACSTCHSGSFPPADGKPGNHIPYQTLAGTAITNCDSCHKGGYSSWNPGRFHSNVPISNQCASCHLMPTYGLTSKPANSIHATITGNCESCHNTSGWAGAKFDHPMFNANTNCTTCHNGSSATGKPAASHIPTTANCYSCHNTTGWTPTKWNHTQVNVINNCATCHTGTFGKADGRPRDHIPYQSLAGTAITNCDTCHKGGYSSWNPGRFHSNVPISNQCASCHLMPTYGLTSKPSNSTHATVTGNCENCHNTSGWTGAKVDHSLFNASTNCTTCHNGGTASGKPAKHIPVTINCFACHNTTGWTPTKWNHGLVNTSNCASCHTGGYQGPDGRPGNHIPYQSIPGLVAPNCDTCHKNGTSKWNPGKLHSSVSVLGQCASCHTGTYLGPGGKPNNHVPYQMLTGVAITNCDSCHKSGVSSWAPGRVHSNVSLNSQCSTCHFTTVYGLTGKPLTATHNGIVGNCESCHKSTASWTSNVSYTHALGNAVGTGTCDNCHNGSTAAGKPGNHIPILVGNVKCDSCHKSQQAWASSVTMNHTVVISTQLCKTCHATPYVGSGALAKPNNHIPYESQLLNGATLDCKSCHNSTNAGGFGTAVMNHNNTRGAPSGTCYGCHNAGTAYLGNMERKSLSHRKSGSTDCSQSGCHRPIGNVGADYRKWD